MSTRFWSTRDDKNAVSTLDPAEWNHFARRAENAATGALLLLGAGVLDSASLRVSLLSSSIQIAPGLGIAVHSIFGPAFLEQATIGALDDDEVLPDGGEVFVMAALQIAPPLAAGVVDPGLPDTREDRAPRFLLNDTRVLDGAIPLARLTIVDGAITRIDDVRPRFDAGSEILDRLYGNGRIVGLDSTEGAPSVGADTLFITLPAATYISDGNFYTIEATTIEAPANFSGWAVLSFDEDKLPQILDSDWRSAKPTAGSGIIGKVTTDADKVVSIDATDEDIIQPEYVKQARLRAIEGVPIGGGGGGTIGDATAIAQMREMIKGLVSRIEELEGKSGEGVQSLMSDYERLDAENIGQDLAIVALNPNYAQDANESILWDSTTGNGETVSPAGNQPNVNAGGNEPLGG